MIEIYFLPLIFERLRNLRTPQNLIRFQFWSNVWGKLGSNRGRSELGKNETGFLNSQFLELRFKPRIIPEVILLNHQHIWKKKKFFLVSESGVPKVPVFDSLKLGLFFRPTSPQKWWTRHLFWVSLLLSKILDFFMFGLFWVSFWAGFRTKKKRK